jgi:hypothetical protein
MQRPNTTDGLFHDGNPLTGTKGTPITADWLNALMGVSTLFSGATEPPAAGLGADGDFYICTQTRNMYGPKTSGAWGAAWTQGLPGPRGFYWYTGAGAPGAIVGQIDGDLYLNTVNDDIYRRAAAVWGVIGNIKGTAGQQGPAGTANSPYWADVVTVAQASYTITGYDVIYLCDTTATTIAATVPTAVGNKGRRIYLENNGTTSNLLTITPFGAETIEGAATLDLDCGMGRTIYSNGANWRVMRG